MLFLSYHFINIFFFLIKNLIAYHISSNHHNVIKLRIIIIYRNVIKLRIIINFLEINK